MGAVFFAVGNIVEYELTDKSVSDVFANMEDNWIASRAPNINEDGRNICVLLFIQYQRNTTFESFAFPLVLPHQNSSIIITIDHMQRYIRHQHILIVCHNAFVNLDHFSVARNLAL